MTDIKPWIHIVVGLIVGAVSFMLKMYIFVPVGAGLVVWGFIKLPKQKPKPAEHVPRCPFCHHHIRPIDNFCPNCGAYLKYNRGYPNLNSSSQNQNHNRQYNQVRRIN